MSRHQHSVQDSHDGEEPLDAGLAAGFGPEPVASMPAPSILEHLAQRSGVPPRLVLRQPAGAGTQSCAPGKYEFNGEIARGGVGIVFRGRDRDLNRDVAIKVLHERLSSEPALIERFVEEAQIGGQLQHPGIVPVYDLGLRDGRPFFTMKLIEGRTLADLLTERANLHHDRRRFLTIFEQVCQTVAYAHARGVIHRDLKPSNVMVGAFGETQVVDWGMAKVLVAKTTADASFQSGVGAPVVATLRSAGASPSCASGLGSVMGTPAYMPPEQARGDVSHMDERSDVFALGAILCELLSGAPPYHDASGDLLAMAARSDLTAAHRRLDSCGADDELIALARDCLAPSPTARPRHAQEVAARIGAHLTSTEERVQQARVAAAEQRIETKAARRSQRLTLALAASVLATVLLGGGGYVWLQAERAARGVAVATQVEATLAEATRLRGAAQGKAGHDVASWERARGQATAAQTLAASIDGGADLRVRVATFATELSRSEAESAHRAEQVERDRAMVTRLEEILVPRDDDLWSFDRSDAERRDSAYARAFADYGIDAELGEQAMVEAITRSAILSELALALDDWSAARSAALAPAEAIGLLQRVARTIDPDPWRNRLRDFIGAGQLKEVCTLATEADPKTLPTVTLFLMGRALTYDVATVADAVTLLSIAQRQQPSSFRVALQLATAYRQLTPPNLPEAIRFFSVAVALRPHSVEARHQLGITLEQAGALDEALALFRSDPPSVVAAHWNYHVGCLLAEQGDIDGAIQAYRETLRLQPGDLAALNNLGSALEKKGDFDGAILAFREVIRHRPLDAQVHINLGIALRHRGDIAGATDACRQAVALQPDSAMAYYNLGLALREQRDLVGAIAAFREVIRLTPSDAYAHAELATSLCASGDLTGAVTACHEALALKPRFAHAHLVLGRVLSRQGERDGAITEFREAIRCDPLLSPAHTCLGDSLFVRGDVAEALAAFQEAIRLEPRSVEAHRGVANVMIKTGDRAGAIAALRTVVRLKPRDDPGHYRLGIALAAAGDLSGAESSYRAAIEAQPDHAQAWCNLGQVLRRGYRFAESLSAYERGHELGSKLVNWQHPSHRWVAEARTLAQNEAALLVVARGEATPKDPAQAVAAAQCARRAGLHRRALELYREAFAADPDLESRHRYPAACAAACMAAHEDEAVVAAAERARCREQARHWLREDLEVWRARLANGTQERREEIGLKLRHWQANADLAGMREGAQLDRLPESERAALRELWRDVQSLLELARR